MATAEKNLSVYNEGNIPSAKNMKFGIVVSEWNESITGALRDGAVNALEKHKAKKKNIIIKTVPGSFELTFGAKLLADSSCLDAVICLGCVIQGETRHFEFICHSVSQGITNLNLNYGIPIIFGVLTTNNLIQAKERAGGKYGNKGDEAAITAIKMVALKNELVKSDT